MAKKGEIKNRIGETRRNKDKLGGYEMKIVEYNRSDDIWIEFQDEHKTRINTTYDCFQKGKIKNPYHKSVCGVGYIGEGKYKKSNNGKHTKVYDTWVAMINRCYNPYYINKHLTYIDVTVCEEWHCFQDFGKWFEKNYYEIENEVMHLDKDILIKGNKIYSPETCVFVSNNINMLFVKRQKCRGEYPIGVYMDKKINKLCVRCCVFDKEKNRGITKYIGKYNTIETAFLAYKNFKEKHIKEIADEYKDLIPEKLYKAMYEYKVEIND